MVKKREGIVTKSEIAKHFNVTHTTVTRWENDLFSAIFKKHGKEEQRGLRIYYSYDERILNVLEKQIRERKQIQERMAKNIEQLDKKKGQRGE